MEISIGGGFHFIQTIKQRNKLCAFVSLCSKCQIIGKKKPPKNWKALLMLSRKDSNPD
jgi:hypothetical protein